MTSAAVLQRLQLRASQADLMLNQLRDQLRYLKSKAVAAACQEEEESLRNENENLKKDVIDLKNRLIAAEIQNGVMQVPLPTVRMVAAMPTVVSGMSVEKTVATSSTQSRNQPQKQKKDQKQTSKGGNKEKPSGASDRPIDVSMLNMRIGHIVNVKKHPDADTLYVEEVDVGEGSNRTIVSGLVKHVPLEQMQNRIAIFCCNLKPAKMRGIMSEGMIMCGSSPDKVEIIEPPADSVKGERVIVDGFPGDPEPLLPPKKKLFEQIQPELRINEAGVATYKGKLWKVEGRDGICTVPTMRNSGIK